jgi:hypothetical protein
MTLLLQPPELQTCPTHPKLVTPYSYGSFIEEGLEALRGYTRAEQPNS